MALRHLQRGGAPTAYDRRMGRKFGVASVDMIVNEDFGRMVGIKTERDYFNPAQDGLRKITVGGRGKIL